ncbi:3-isopropylmalate/(R)-2-methylmalate dehydratase large subunit [Sphingopyxis sp. YR583]|uniref:3-isopropylmalate dehydratase large subunit n=1 Tax=Sphingopyxis sp. YR583 TaxID=1881047 RepID=UPI0008A7C9C3|nr:3-isopropylmalate dehydratase large subunit [Sphingopyxis sp. YR583]SEH19908.1 3-isopropylmalate/(R)-2-methylmalate dehydratase large subunit [Sphingopyxis sp. YR583]
MSAPKTLYDKIVDEHRILSFDESGDAGERLLLYIDRTVLNEYTSPQAFSGLRAAGRKPWRPAASLGVVDHVNSTNPDAGAGTLDDGARRQIEYLGENGHDFGIEIFDLFDPRQGIEHVVMPELGMVLPGMVIAAGDSHSTTYGAFGVVGFGIGTSDIEHLLATQTLVYRRLKAMRVNVDGRLAPGVTAKDLIMEVIRRIGADGASGHAVEFAGTAIEALGVEARMTICNMAVECGARVALMAPDEKVIDYIAGCPRAPSAELLEQARAEWSLLHSDPGALFHKEIELDAGEVPPMVSWGTSPDQSLAITDCVPDPDDIPVARRADAVRAMAYMGLSPNTPLQDIAIDRAFIGSCTNARLSDLRDAAKILKGRKVAPGVRAMISPGSSNVRRAAEDEGIDRIFIDAGFEWRRSGCSLCLAMNDDSLAPGERCASSTNRNFEGRQGIGGRTHLMSPAMVAAAAVTGKLADVRSLAAVGAS